MSASMAETPSIVIENHEGDEWLRSIMEKGEDTALQETKVPKIQKVPQMLRKVESSEKFYDPFVVSIGPYHHGKKEFEEIEKRKMTMACQFVRDSGKPIEVLYNKVADVSSLARECYAEHSTDDFDDEKFARMMFLDGCFVLHFMHCLLGKCENFKMKLHVKYCVIRDLLLLENQIPFLVLHSLMSLRYQDHEKEWKQLIECFINEHVRFLPPRHDSWWVRVLKCFPRVQANSKAQENKDHESVHLLERFHSHLIEKKTPSIWRSKKKDEEDLFRYRSAKDLSSVGIHFRPSSSDKFTNIKYESTFLAGTLRLPRINVDDLTESLMLNLVAYETCSDATDSLEITSYICFMDALIDHPEDVKLLRSKGILLNFLGSDEHVANLFNKISDNLVPNRDAYFDVKRGIESQYKNLIKKWTAEWLHTHFNSPWTFLAFVAAVFALILSAIQTYKTVYP